MNSKTIRTIQLGRSFMVCQVKVHQPICTTSLWISSGSSSDKKAGLTHLTEHLINYGSLTYKNKVERLREIEAKGAYFNAHTTEETVSLIYKHSPQDRYEILKLLAQDINGSQVSEQDIEDEKKSVIQEIENYQNTPSEYIYTLNKKSLWPKTQISNSIIGTPQSITNIHVDEINNRLQDLKTKNLTTLLVIGPSFLTQKEIQLLKNVFKHSIETISQDNNTNTSPPKTSNPQTVFLENPTKSANIGLAFPVNSINAFEDRVATEYLMHILTGGWSSKLIDQLRVKKNLVYWVWGSTRYFRDAGIITFNTSCQIDSVETVIDAIIKEITKLHDPNNIDLNRKKKIINDFMSNSLDPEWLHWWYGWQSALGSQIHTIEDFFEQIQNLDTQTLTNKANQIFQTSQMGISIIAPNKPSNL